MKVSKIAITLCIAALITVSSCAKEKGSNEDTPAHGDSGHVHGANEIDSGHSALDGHNHDSVKSPTADSSGHTAGDGHKH